MRNDIDIDAVNKMLKASPKLKDACDLASRFGTAVRKHFKGRTEDQVTVIAAAITAIDSALLRLPPDERAEIADECSRHFPRNNSFNAAYPPGKIDDMLRQAHAEHTETMRADIARFKTRKPTFPNSAERDAFNRRTVAAMQQKAKRP
jgi:hypothetical protein